MPYVDRAVKPSFSFGRGTRLMQQLATNSSQQQFTKIGRLIGRTGTVLETQKTLKHMYDE